MNRLKLDFSLETNEERSQFVQEYLQQSQFISQPPTSEELSTIADYILWGKDPVTGLNSRQDKFIQLFTRNGTWDSSEITESYEALLEQPSFNEILIRPSDEPRTKKVRIVFSRDKARAECPQELLSAYESLWREIDEIDLKINYYELAHGRRKNPPRSSLLIRFTDEERQNLLSASTHLNQYQYLKLRHYLVELRRQQFTMQDTYKTHITLHDAEIRTPQTPPAIDDNICCYPIGLAYPSQAHLFPRTCFPYPDLYTDSQIESAIKLYWEKQQNCKATQRKFDFRNEEDIATAFQFFENFEDDATIAQIESNASYFLDTLNFYITRADIPANYREILNLKLHHYKNNQIATHINTKYNKHYTDNYISTIFRKKIIPKICDAARYHADAIENLTFPENYKTCRVCKQTYVISPNHFVRKTRSQDGFTNRCKLCDRAAREARK